MIEPKLPENEEGRLEALFALNILDTPAEERFDRVTRLAAALFDVPIVLVSLLDEHRQWFKSRYGLETPHTPRRISFCGHTIHDGAPLVIPDALLDARFLDNPLVIGEPHIRFYAGYPIRGPDGQPLGTLCIIDIRSRQASDIDMDRLRDLAALVEEEIRAKDALRESEARFRATFEQAAVGLAHVGLDGHWLRVNQKLCDIVGYSPSEFAGLTFQDITHPDDLTPDLNLVQEVLNGNRKSFSLEKRYIQKDGGVVWVNLTVSLKRHLDGAPKYFISVIEDIQQRKKTELSLQRVHEQLEERVEQRTQDLKRSNEILAFEIQQRQQAETVLKSSEERFRTIIKSSHDAFVGIDSTGLITDWNDAAEKTFGWTPQEVIGRDVAEILIPFHDRVASRRRLDYFLHLSKNHVINRRLEMQALARTGDQFPVEMTISAFRNDGTYHFGAFLHDISERKRIARELEQKQKLLDAVLETIDVGVVACSANGELTLFNRAAREFHGLSAQDIQPDQWASQYSLFMADGKTHLQMEDVPLYRALQGETVKDAEMTIVTTGSQARFLLASGKPLMSSIGEKIGAVVAMSDITGRKEAERRLALSEQRLRAITENLPTLIGHIDKDEKFVFLNNKAARFYGKEAHELLGRHVQEAYSESEYRHVKPYIDSVLLGKRITFENQIVIKGKPHYYHAIYIPDIDQDGIVSGFYAMAFDITDRKNSELRQAESEERLRTITDSLPVLISYIDQEECYRFSNATYQDWFSYSPTEMIGKTVREVVGAEIYELRKEHLHLGLAGESIRFETEGIVKGEMRYVETTYIPHVRNNIVEGIYTLSTNITPLKIVEKQLSLLARLDPLTALPNRRSFEEKLNEAAVRSCRTCEPIALMFLDIDHFKSINDTFGHAGGDDVLKEFANRVKASVRATDSVSRLAGDEFTIILEGVRIPNEAAVVAKKILASVEKPILTQGKPFSVTTSIGIAFLMPNDSDISGLVNRADEALYRAKAAGRNQFCINGEVQTAKHDLNIRNATHC